MRARWSGKGRERFDEPIESWEPTNIPVCVEELSDGVSEHSMKSGVFSLPKSPVDAPALFDSQQHDLNSEFFEEPIDLEEPLYPGCVGSAEQLEREAPIAKRLRYDVVDISSPVDETKQGGANNVELIPLPQRLVADALKVTEKRQFLYPWEKGRLGRFYNPSSSSSLPSLPKLHPGSSNVIQVQLQVDDKSHVTGTLGLRAEQVSTALHVSVVKSRVGVSYLEERGAKRDMAIRQWCELLSWDWEQSDPGLLTLSECPNEDYHSYCCAVLDACFGVKSPNTLLKRLYAVKSFHEWLGESDGRAWLPLQERDVWNYLCMLKDCKAPATKATSFIEAVRFVHFVFHVEGAWTVLESTTEG